MPAQSPSHRMVCQLYHITTQCTANERYQTNKSEPHSTGFNSQCAILQDSTSKYGTSSTLWKMFAMNMLRRNAFRIGSVCQMRLRRLGTLLLCEIEGKGRGLVAQEDLKAGSVVLECTPIAKVLKKTPGTTVCKHCLGLIPDTMQMGALCSHTCESEYQANGGYLLERCDLQELHTIQADQGRKFPLMVSQLLAALLAGIQRTGKPPAPWHHALSLCHAVLPPEIQSQVS